MWRHMDKLPQRLAIIDSPQWCTQLGTFTNKGCPINISHAGWAGDSGSGRSRGERSERIKIMDKVSWFGSYLYHSLSTSSLYFSHEVGRSVFIDNVSHCSLITVINVPLPPPSGLTRPPSVRPTVTPTTDTQWSFHVSQTLASAGEVIHGILTKAVWTSSV